ncbi:MAG: flagellar FlbD family protein [Planctomycetes bacterium]|nr:flagellar FlbD family protein [Planctomycetota bacterium]
MIRLTRLNDRPIVVHVDQIQFVEETPDTLVTLVNHDRILVRESVDEVVRRAVEFLRTVRSFAP